ncbi:hypothetical protein EMIHUDRAFT_97328 [Emiliania huxleyi CCMP1516]|uniref:Uncharacterized protein n=2 Tax=Emiliania huxleyi TaxID=2903 RepID=A0A0D3I2F9_EMIH1|nr:hypothetical protein EMIHUDRAFT_97328 [Emiliania huxleyi CCMP1516]EOD05444.1 hypothetical protein EMIHUDRAFT_97328 [Emiliania huxleyi CCMP1516]|eukprot:XP_005757873.1 hypothetical protein EMIHUDRAFT_97328 [Emiliania huxleyi CCMP1516]
MFEDVDHADLLDDAGGKRGRQSGAGADGAMEPRRIIQHVAKEDGGGNDPHGPTEVARRNARASEQVLARAERAKKFGVEKAANPLNARASAAGGVGKTEAGLWEKRRDAEAVIPAPSGPGSVFCVQLHSQPSPQPPPHPPPPPPALPAADPSVAWRPRRTGAGLGSAAQPAATSSAHLCWGAQLAGTERCPMVTPKSPAFRDRFCAACREGPIIVPCSRIRVLDGSLPAPSNSRAEGMWNAQKTKPPFWPAHRVVNQTADTFGLRLIILRDETSDPLHGLAPLPAEFGSAIAFLVRRTLTPVPMPGMPTQLVQALRGTGQGGTLARSAAPSRLLLRAGSSGDGSTVALVPPCLPPLEEALVLPLGPAPAAAAAASAQPLRWRFGELVDAVAADASAAELMQLLVPAALESSRSLPRRHADWRLVAGGQVIG